MMAVQGECIDCGIVIPYGDPADDMFPAILFLTVPGRGMFKATIFKAELRCKNQQMCAERRRVSA